MKAISVAEDKSLHWAQTDTPVPGKGEVRIRIHATAINRADLLQRQGHYPPPPGASPIIGLECAGEIDAVGEGVTSWQPGDAVCALLSGGGYAEYCVVPAGSVVPVPKGLSMVEAAALPEVFATAWLNLFVEAGMQSGEKVILHAGASGVGTAAIQLCKTFGSQCFVTAGDDAKIDRCILLGASAGVNRHEGSFLEKAGIFAGEKGVDIILDPVGGAYLNDNMQLLGLNGRLVLIGLMGGLKADINLAVLMAKRLRLIGSTLRARPNEEKAGLMSQLAARVWPKFASGEIKPVIDSVYPITSAMAAYERVGSNQTFGKVCLSVID
ncbi:MAG: NAD(P)H-quinone oxidoreductase [Gammaproteobacteria bacterium]|nr:NAD(P)H-quinone oxidoreductase [Gammaproteobacteria bacterium]